MNNSFKNDNAITIFEHDCNSSVGVRHTKLEVEGGERKEGGGRGRRGEGRRDVCSRCSVP
jgi:hypothetical protein